MRHERVPGQAIVGDVICHIIARPMCERVHFDPTCSDLFFKEIKSFAAISVEALAPGDPAVERVKCVLERFGFSKCSACVRVAQVQITVRVAQKEFGSVRLDHANV